MRRHAHLRKPTGLAEKTIRRGTETMSLPLTQKVTVKGRANEITDSEEDRGF